MSDLRFATLCDFCGARSGEYEFWPVCSECFDHACRDCSVPERYDEGDGRTLCKRCHDEQRGMAAILR